MTTPDAPTAIWQRVVAGRWQRRWLPGLTVISLVILARALGWFQVLEWKTLDVFLRWRPAEPPDERVLVVGINEADIQRLETYPVPDGDLAVLIQALSEYEPRAIGIDIYREFPVEPGHDLWLETVGANPNVIAVEKILGFPIPPPALLSPGQVGFVDFPLDDDGFVRRTYLGVLPSLEASDPDRFRFSFALRLTEAYLAAENLTLETGRRDQQAMRFGDTELFRLRPHSGGYVRADSAGVQALINPRSGASPFETVSMTDVIEGRVSAEQVHDRVVLIGITALSVKDLVNSAAVDTENPGLVYGVIMHAHVTSQLLSTVLDRRPMLKAWADGGEIVWIVLWGMAGMAIASLRLPALKYASITLGLGLVGLGAGFGLLWLTGLWIPVVPSTIIFLLLALPGFFLYEATLRSRIEERQRVIETTYDAIHNGPLQSLALLLQQREVLKPAVGSKLEQLNRELRAIYTHLLQESLPQTEQLQLGNQRVIDLRNPLVEVLYEVYLETLKRDFPAFHSLKFKVVTFEPLAVEGLSSDDKRSLCRFLEEALCNVGKHAHAPKRLTVICQATETENLIRVADNGQNPSSSKSDHGGRGTQQARILAKRLRGKFQRSISETGSVCELRWPIRAIKWWC